MGKRCTSGSVTKSTFMYDNLTAFVFYARCSICKRISHPHSVLRLLPGRPYPTDPTPLSTSQQRKVRCLRMHSPATLAAAMAFMSQLHIFTDPCHRMLQVNSKYIAEDLVQDFDAGLEYAEAECIVDVQQKGDDRQYLIRYLHSPLFCSPRICSAAASLSSAYAIRVAKCDDLEALQNLL